MKDFYFEVAPSPALEQYISCIWTEEYFNQPTNRSKEQLILPDNTIELVFSEAEFKRKSKQCSEKMRSHISGLKTTAQKIELNKSALISVRFKPFMFYRLCNVDFASLVNSSTSPKEIFGNEIVTLEDQLFELKTFEERVVLIEGFFQKRIDNSSFKEDESYEYAARILQESSNSINITQLADLSHISIKSLERKFKRYLGISPKKFQSLIRVIKSLKIETILEAEQLSDIAYSNGFYDQMHFIKSVKQFTGLTPSQLKAKDRGIQTPIFS